MITPPVSTIIAQWLLVYRYQIAYPLGIIHGPLVMFLSGILVRLGILEFWTIYFVLIGSDLTGDVVWYYVGRHGAATLIEKYGRFLGISRENLEGARGFFHGHQAKILFISKMTAGFGFAPAVLVAAGAAKVSFKRYMLINFFGEFIWAGFLIGMGYFWGHLYTLVDKSLRIAFITAVIIILGFALYGFSRFMKEKFVRKDSENI